MSGVNDFLTVTSLVSQKLSHPWLRGTQRPDGKTLSTFPSLFFLLFLRVFLHGRGSCNQEMALPNVEICNLKLRNFHMTEGHSISDRPAGKRYKIANIHLSIFNLLPVSLFVQSLNTLGLEGLVRIDNRSNSLKAQPFQTQRMKEMRTKGLSSWSEDGRT